jgi:hypothetical protein
MSFQGDVAGIGLGELLQGLARGGKDGVLSLYGKDLSACIGLKGGLLYMLESPEESEAEWRTRTEQAWANDPDPNLAAARRTAIARAERMETVFRMLEAPNLHFRFEQGPLPLPRNARLQRAAVYAMEGQGAEVSPWGQGMGVEAVLLEHARISDESSGVVRPDRYDVPVRQDGGRERPELHLFLSQCDGHSTVMEIADRLAWTLRQTQGQLVDLVRTGYLRLAVAQELLALAQYELEQGRDLRAGTRLRGWLRLDPAGPPGLAESEALLAAWESGRLGDVLRTLPQRVARTLVRKLDLLSNSLADRLDRWEDLADYHPQDLLARFKRAALRVAAAGEGQEIEGGGNELVMECLRLARTFGDQGNRQRSRVMLRLAATTQPESPQTRTELGARMIEAGLHQDGAAWMLEAAKSLIEELDLDRAVQVLSVLLKGVPDHREAQALQTRTRSRIARSKNRRKHSIVGLCGALAISLVAFVQFHSKQDRDRKFAEISAVIDQPTRALELLEQYFSGDDSDRISALRTALEQRQRDVDRERKETWTQEFDRARTTIESGDPQEGYRLLEQLSRPPRLDSGLVVQWGTQADLLALLVARMRLDAVELNPAVGASAEELQREARLLQVISSLIVASEGQSATPFQLLREDLGKLSFEVHERRAARERALADKSRADLQNQQDLILASARFQKQSGQLAQAVHSYDELLALDTDGEIRELLAPEVDEARSWLRALERSQGLARAGEHERALSVLEEAGLDGRRFPLQWRVESAPSGTQVTLGDGSQRTTPFVLETSVGERVELSFTREGYESRSYSVERPGDLVAPMHRVPERTWQSSHRIEAVPVPVGPDHLVADRFGRVERLSPQGQVLWSVALETLAGIARTPQFLPGQPGKVLLLAEDGQAWSCDVGDGTLAGPVDLGAPVLEGPYPISTGLVASFENGTYAVWNDSLDPIVRPSISRDELKPTRESPYDEGNSNMVVLRAGRGLDPELPNPWTKWRVEVRSDHYHVRLGGSAEESFTVRRAGEWSFLAWEVPSTLVPGGRLWISDAEGLRSFLPAAQPTSAR